MHMGFNPSYGTPPLCCVRILNSPFVHLDILMMVDISADSEMMSHFAVHLFSLIVNDAQDPLLVVLFFLFSASLPYWGLNLGPFTC